MQGNKKSLDYTGLLVLQKANKQKQTNSPQIMLVL